MGCSKLVGQPKKKREAKDETKRVPKVMQDGVQGYVSPFSSIVVCDVIVGLCLYGFPHPFVQLRGNMARRIHNGFITLVIKSLHFFIGKCMQFRFSSPLHSESSATSRLLFWVRIYSINQFYGLPNFVIQLNKNFDSPNMWLPHCLTCSELIPSIWNSSMDIAVVGNRVNSQHLELKHGYCCCW